MPSSSHLESVTATLSRNVASHVSRRSFLGWAGRMSMVMATAGTVVGLTAQEAFATIPCSCNISCDAGCGGSRTCHCQQCGHSVTCGALGSSGTCPTNTVACGSWVCTCSSCGSGFKRWTDCCGTGQCGSARCVTDTDGVSRPSCTYKKCWSGGGSDCGHFIVCRHGNCT